MPTPTWDLLDSDCSTLTGWTVTTAGSGTVTQVTEDGRSCIKCYNPGGAGDRAAFERAVTWNQTCTFEFDFKILDSNQDGCNPYTNIVIRDTNNYTLVLNLAINTADLNHPVAVLWKPTSNIATAYVDISPTTWHTCRIVIKDLYCTMWIDGLVYQSSVGPITTEVSTVNRVLMDMYLGRKVTIYFDNIKVSSTPAEPDTVAPVKIFDQDLAQRMSQTIKELYPTSGLPESPVKYYKTNCTETTNMVYEIPLVSTSASTASAVRVYDGSSTYSLMGLPLFISQTNICAFLTTTHLLESTGYGATTYPSSGTTGYNYLVGTELSLHDDDNDTYVGYGGGASNSSYVATGAISTHTFSSSALSRIRVLAWTRHTASNDTWYGQSQWTSSINVDIKQSGSWNSVWTGSDNGASQTSNPSEVTCDFDYTTGWAGVTDIRVTINTTITYSTGGGAKDHSNYAYFYEIVAEA